MKSVSKASRREFIKKSAALTLTHAAAPLAASLTLMNNAAAETATDYKALVCVFLYGGNDHYGMVIPYDQMSYDQYSGIRTGPATTTLYPYYQGIAIKRDSLIPLNVSVPTAQSSATQLQMALHPEMKGMAQLFNIKRAGMILNVGPLITPTTAQQFKSKSVPLPPNLMSHNNQQAYWQSAFRGETAPTGWGGRMVDLFLSQNNNANLSCASITGDALILSGKNTISTKLSTTGVKTLNPLHASYGNSSALNLLKSWSLEPSNHLMTNEYAHVMARSMNTYELVASKVGTGDLKDTFLCYMPSAHFQKADSPYNTTGVNQPAKPLAQQLEMVARLIQQGPALGLKRQVFMVGIGGFDLHDNLPTQHPHLLKMLSDTCHEFDMVMQKLELTKAIPPNSVTTFTASDFGRTLSSNGDGSDHGWGSHHFMLGGAVNGGQIYGLAPDIALTHNQSLGGGILIPSTSLEQMFVPVARWFGVSQSNMSVVFPHSQNFNLDALSTLMKKSAQV